MKPRLLDLFSGAGGCAVGYARAGFEVVGIDIVEQPNYPYDFVQRDALEYVRNLDHYVGLLGAQLMAHITQEVAA